MVPMTATNVAALRNRTGAPLMKCKAALLRTEGDLLSAEQVLREEGIGGTPVQTVGNHGFLAVYVHPGSQIAGCVELACATEYAGRLEEFRRVAHELAMQVAATAPIAISLEDLTPDQREQELTAARAKVRTERRLVDKSESFLESTAQTRATASLRNLCLLSQPYIRDTAVPVQSLIDSLKLAVHEEVYVRRISRWRVGEPL